MARTTQRSTSTTEFGGTLNQRQWKLLAFILGKNTSGQYRSMAARKEWGITEAQKLAHHSEFDADDHMAAKALLDKYSSKMPPRYEL